MKKACVNCSVPFRPEELFDGFCTECWPTDGPVLPDEDHDFLDDFAIAECRAAGLNVISRPCGHPKCETCKAIERSKEQHNVERVRYVVPRTEVAFTEVDALELERYFRMTLPSPAWDRSTFGEMCQRIGEATNPHTEYRPTKMEPRCPVTYLQKDGDAASEVRMCGRHLDDKHVRRLSKPTKKGDRRTIDPHGRGVRTAFLAGCRTYETEVGGRLVQVTVLPGTKPALDQDRRPVFDSHVMKPAAGGGESSTYDEGDIASYFDARYRMRDVYRVLSRVPRWVYDVLDAKYSQSQERAASDNKLGQLAAVALLTDTLKHVRDNRARDTKGSHPTLRSTLDELMKFSRDSTVTAQVRSSATVALERIRKEADRLVRDAEHEYAVWARRMAAR